jgi:hypothetical protein
VKPLQPKPFDITDGKLPGGPWIPGPRPVYILREGDSFVALCDPCVAGLHSVQAGRRAIVARADDAHCIECDYHATCLDGCAAKAGIAAYQAALSTLVKTT